MKVEHYLATLSVVLMFLCMVVAAISYKLDCTPGFFIGAAGLVCSACVGLSLLIDGVK